LYETLPGAGADVVLLYRASRPEDLVFWEELGGIARGRGFGLYPVVGTRAQHGRDPLDAETLLRLVPDASSGDVYVCGPPGLTGSLTTQLRRAGVDRRRIHVEAFDL
jgi:ferredoxin-NADP reductase